MRRILILTCLTFLPFAVQGDEGGWYFLPKEGRCTPLIEMYKTFPELKGATTPDAVFRLLKQRAPDAKLQRFLDMVEENKRKGAPPPNAEEMEIFRQIGDSAAFILSAESTGFEALILNENTCKRVQSAIDSSPA